MIISTHLPTYRATGAQIQINTDTTGSTNFRKVKPDSNEAIVSYQAPETDFKGEETGHDIYFKIFRVEINHHK